MNNGRSIGVLIVVAIVAAFIGYQVGHTAGESQVRTRLTAKAGRIESDLLATIGGQDQALAAYRRVSAAASRVTTAHESFVLDVYDNAQAYLRSAYEAGLAADQDEAEAIARSLAFKEEAFRASLSVGDPVKSWARDEDVDLCRGNTDSG